MPKMKTNSAAKKRFGKTASGRIKRSKAYRRHHAWAKSHKTVRQARNTRYLANGDEANIKRLLPN